MEAQHHSATDWKCRTGEGVENEETLHSVILKKCPHFFELDLVMGARPSAGPMYTNEDSSIDVRDTDDEDDVAVNNATIDPPTDPPIDIPTEDASLLLAMCSSNTTTTLPLVSAATSTAPSTNYSTSPLTTSSAIPSTSTSATTTSTDRNDSSPTVITMHHSL